MRPGHPACAEASRAPSVRIRSPACPAPSTSSRRSPLRKLIAFTPPTRWEPNCASGVRSYLATRILRGEGIDARNLSGGWLTLQAVHPDAVRQPAMTTA